MLGWIIFTLFFPVIFLTGTRLLKHYWILNFKESGKMIYPTLHSKLYSVLLLYFPQKSLVLCILQGPTA